MPTTWVEPDHDWKPEMLTRAVGSDGSSGCAQDVEEGSAHCYLGCDAALCAGQHILCESGNPTGRVVEMLTRSSLLP